MRILVRATNWLGDAVMSLPALHAVRHRFPTAHITVHALPWVADLYAREPFCDAVILHTAARGWRDWRGKLSVAREVRAGQFDVALLLPNSFDAAFIPWLARVPERYGYNRDGRRLLLTHAVEIPTKGEIPAHEQFYYLELLRRIGWLDALPTNDTIRLSGTSDAAGAGQVMMAVAGLPAHVIGVSPGAAYGTAKRWLPERFAAAALRLAHELHAGVALFGSAGERSLCNEIADQIRPVPVHNFAGETTLAQFIECAAACQVFLTNDSGSMHVASALGVPTVAVFGATSEVGTGPTGPLARVVREPVECSPCLLRECPIDHRCMTRVSSERVANTALELLK